MSSRLNFAPLRGFLLANTLAVMQSKLLGSYFWLTYVRSEETFVLLWYPLLVACSIGRVGEWLKVFLSSFVGVKNSRFFLSVEKYLQQVCFFCSSHVG